MATTVGKYTFGSWLRKGIANDIGETDTLGGGVTGTLERSAVSVNVTLNGTNLHRQFSLLGPCDVIGVNPQMIVRTEPLDWVTNFEPNYFAFIEFYDEDFIWRYTPAAANGQRLRPWLALLVLAQGKSPDDSEFELDEKTLPLPSVTVKALEALPPVAETFAWGHVHVNEGHASPTEFEQFLLSLHDLNHPNADKIICRLVCPRRLLPNTAYRAFVVPAFEAGRLAGLGLPTTGVKAQQAAWGDGAANLKFPIYHQWYFRTGENEDFESLVKLLEPRAMDPRVGIRDMDGSKPGFGMIQGADIGPIAPVGVPPVPADQKIVGLEGAMKAPTTKSRPEAIDISRPFFGELRDILNFPASLLAATNGSSDPVVSPPLYGENHARKHELELANAGWLHELNRDPRSRTPAGFGTNVIKENQENLVARAWDQVKRILEANRRIALTKFAMVATDAFHKNLVKGATAERVVTFFSPVLRKVKGSPTTLQHQLETSRVPLAAASPAFRRLLRPRGAYARRLRKSDAKHTHARLFSDLNEGRASPAPAKQTPATLPTDDRLAKAASDLAGPTTTAGAARNRRLFLLLLAVVLLLVALASGAWVTALLLGLSVLGLYALVRRSAAEPNPLKNVQAPARLLEQLASTPPQPDFALTLTDPVVSPTSTGATTVSVSEEATSGGGNAAHFSAVRMKTPGAAGEDSVEAANFRRAALSLNQRLAIEIETPARARFDLENAKQKLAAALDPGRAFPQMLAAQVRFEFDKSWLGRRERLVPAMAYPDFDDPMYEKLRDISSELLLPNLSLIPPNTISLLVTNSAFIEAYMVGLNHEFGRELLWREYPTDQRGSYFRQFWDVRGIVAPDSSLSPEQLSARYKDIVPLDTWLSASKLGEHRPPSRPAGKQVVLVVRGELLKKYPNTIIYAQKAHIHRDDQGQPEPAEEPVILPVTTEAEMASELKFPIFRAEIDPDLRFFGFDLSVEQARGAEAPQAANDDWGYYFVIQQLPGEPRFGMDVRFAPDEDPATPLTWNDLAWDRFPENLTFVRAASPPQSSFFGQLTQDERAQWGQNSADMAAVLYQQPVMIAVHAKQMLKDLDA